MTPPCSRCGQDRGLIYLVAGVWTCFRCRRNLINQEATR